VLTITALGGALGGEATGIDLAKPLNDGDFAEVERAFAAHLVLVIRDQKLAPADQVAFTRRFGAVEPHPLRSRRGADGFPEVLVIENRPGLPGARNDEWHSDITCSERPPALSVLQALVVPQALGATMYCNMYRAYETLSAGMRRMLDGMTALHSAESLVRRNNEPGTDALPIAEAPPPVSHPVVRTHSVTGRPALFVNPSFTNGFDGMTREESAPLLAFLYGHATRPENVYRHAWRPGDVVMWDNRCTMHYAVHDYDETTPRLMHRTTAAGERPYFKRTQAAA
jgi:taurine dioxygenase